MKFIGRMRQNWENETRLTIIKSYFSAFGDGLQPTRKTSSLSSTFALAKNLLVSLIYFRTDGIIIVYEVVLLQFEAATVDFKPNYSLDSVIKGLNKKIFSGQ